MKALDVMVSPVITVSPDTLVAEAADMLLKSRISGMPVLDDTGALVGMVSEGDFCAALKRELSVGARAGSNCSRAAKRSRPNTSSRMVARCPTS